jgi:hypothetical protein
LGFNPFLEALAEAHTPRINAESIKRDLEAKTVNSHIAFRVPPFDFLRWKELSHILAQVITSGASSESEQAPTSFGNR